jgi:hypothetical protein
MLLPGITLLRRVLKQRQAIEDILKRTGLRRIRLFRTQRWRERSNRHVERGKRRCGENHGATNAGSRP